MTVGCVLTFLKTVELSLHAFKLGWLEMATSEFQDFIINFPGFYNILGICNSLQNDELKSQEDMMWEIRKAT